MLMFSSTLLVKISISSFLLKLGNFSLNFVNNYNIFKLQHYDSIVFSSSPRNFVDMCFYNPCTDIDKKGGQRSEFTYSDAVLKKTD